MREKRTAKPRPVFLDRSGRRRRLVKLAGVGLGLVFAAVLALLTAAMSGASPVYVPGFPDGGRNAHSDGAAPEPVPTPVAEPAVEQPVPGVSPRGAATAVTPVPGPPAVSGPPPEQDRQGRVPTHTPSHKGNK